jgi:hypothetical protein
MQFASLKKVKVEPVLYTILGTLPKIREENVSELQMVFEFFRFM